MASIPAHYSSRAGIPDDKALVEYQRFTADYFSGCNVSIFFGDTLVDELVAIEFELKEQILPVYGYASYTYDKICHGSRIATGSFKINFVESGYLMSAMNRLATVKEEESLFLSKLSDGSVVDIESITSQDFISAKQKIPWQALDDYVTAYENYIWGTNEGKNIITPKKDKPYFNRKEEPNDIAFDIMISYSPGMLSPRNTDPSVMLTIESLNDVHIIGCSKIIDPSGQPIQEVYQFIANDWNGSLKNK
jgi:hypothetical protein